jgi:RNA polymerase sigma-70 factor, ECF subfamily
MDFVSSHDVTELLNAWRKGDNDALEKLIPVVYAELHRLASRYMRKEDRAHTLQTTALVHEAYCRLVDQKEAWQNRAHFFGIAAQLMRRILVDHARSHLRIKRGAGAQRISLDEQAIVPETESDLAQVITLDVALKQLAELDSKKSRIVELKFFGGLTMEEIATVEQLSVRTIHREWRKAKAWLYRAITQL